MRQSCKKEPGVYCVCNLVVAWLILNILPSLWQCFRPPCRRLHAVAKANMRLMRYRSRDIWQESISPKTIVALLGEKPL